MTFQFITATVDFIIRTYKTHGMFPEWPEYPEFSFSWGDPSLAPRKQKALKKYSQILLRVEDTFSTNKAAYIKLHQLLPSADIPEGKTDIPIEDASYDRLEDHLEQNSRVEYKAGGDTHIIKFRHSVAGNRNVRITNNAQLVYALKTLRDYGSDQINMEIAGLATATIPSFVVDPPDAWGAEGIRTHPAYDGNLPFTISKPYKIIWEDKNGRYISWAVNLRPLGENKLLHCVLTTTPISDDRVNVGAPRVISIRNHDSEAHQAWHVRVQSHFGAEDDVQLFQRRWGASSSSRAVDKTDKLDRFGELDKMLYL